ncbi:uncharacterized protein [Aristolochia californica]|uniref:uncharacterized protein n=1 Tax=Aristolochia californica TaxID=171875 RepID=UPI0035D6A150
MGGPRPWQNRRNMGQRRGHHSGNSQKPKSNTGESGVCATVVMKNSQLGIDEDKVSAVAQIVEVSLNSVVGLTLPKTIKIAGSIGEQLVVVLIDGGATHNFISTTVVKKLHLLLSPTIKYGIQLGTGAALPREGICKGVRLTLQGIEIVEDFLPLELGNIDVILGVQWLETLGGTYTNWRTHVMKFRLGNEMVVLQRDPSLHKTLVSLKVMMRTIKHEGHRVLVELGSTTMAASPPREDTTAMVKKVLTEFRDVFAMSQELPPQRAKEHAITLEGASPMSVRPYRYPQIQKDEIERLVGEMLAAGIIQPSTSPFSSPVLLVKKKDGS